MPDVSGSVAGVWAHMEAQVVEGEEVLGVAWTVGGRLGLRTHNVLAGQTRNAEKFVEGAVKVQQVDENGAAKTGPDDEMLLVEAWQVADGVGRDEMESRAQVPVQVMVEI